MNALFDRAAGVQLMNEIKYYMAFCAVKKLLAQGVITKENCRQANVALAEKYGVLQYRI